MFTHTSLCIFSSAPGLWNAPQSIFPARNIAGTSTFFPENIRNPQSFPSISPSIARYQFRPPWNPALPNSCT